MDGVIVDTEPLHHKAYFKMFEHVGAQVSEALYETYTGQSTINVCRSISEKFDTDQAPEELVDIKRAYFKDLFWTDPDLNLIEGVRELIQFYHEKDITMVLATSASWYTINSVFERFELSPYFKAKLSGADLKESKPNPEIFIKAAEASGFSKEECMVIEDSTNGIKAASSAGIYCVAFKSPNSKNQDYSKADLVIERFDELYSI